MSFANHEVLPPLASWIRPIIGRDPYNKKNVEESQKKALKAVSVLEEHLLVHTFLVGERITLADLFAAGIIFRGFQYFFDKKWREENPNVTRWYETVYNQPIYSAVVGKLEFIDQAIENKAPKTDKQEKPKKEQAAKKEQPKPKAKEIEEEEEGEEKPAPKPKHPLEALPKATLVLDDWKRKYSNEETREVALPWFWENFNPEEYSIWKCDYKYNDELTQTFMTANLIGTIHFPSPLYFHKQPILILLSRWFLHPSRSLPQIHLRLCFRLRCKERLRYPRRLCHSRPRRKARLRCRA